MSDYIDAVSTALGAFTWQLMTGCMFCLGLELAWPQGSCSIRSRLRSAAAMFLTGWLAATAAASFGFLAGRLGVHPLFRLDPAAVDLPSTPIAAFALAAASWLLSAMLIDFFYYWYHRAAHTVPALWRLHRVHHAIREISAWNSASHLFDALLQIPFVSLPYMLLFGIDTPAAPAAIGWLFGIHGYFIHTCSKAGLGWLGVLVNDARYHRLHHSIEPEHWNCNFAGFVPLWDIVFRTARFPKPGEWPQTGVPGMAECASPLDYLTLPPAVEPARIEDRT